jgi:hypothetical protein
MVLAVCAVVGVACGVLGWFFNNRLGARSVISARLRAAEFQRSVHLR